MERGFSLSEVLVSLVLVTSLSLALLKQQWQLHRMVNQTKLQVYLWLETSNAQQRHDTKRLQQGTSLIELMISLTLAVSIMTLVSQQYVQIKQQFLAAQTTLHHLARLQLALTTVRSSIQKAGFTPCMPLDVLESFDPRSHQPLHAIDFKSSDPTWLSTSHMQDNLMLVDKIIHQQLIYSTTNPSPILQGPLLLADCHHAEVLSEFQQQGSLIKLQHPLTFTYYPPIYLGEWIVDSFGLPSGQQRIKSMFYQHRHRETLLSNVKTMHWQVLHRNSHKVMHLELIEEDDANVSLDIQMPNVTMLLSS